MAETKFYTPYDKRELSKEEFIEIYSSDYFLKQNSEKVVKGIRRSSQWIEDEIERLLKDGIKNKNDIIHILAWKIGKIKHRESQEKKEFVYASDWQNAKDFNVKLYGHELKFESFVNYVFNNIDIIKNKIDNNELQEAMNMLKNHPCNGIGTVYMITLLYFISGSTWPIYDKYAQVAVKAILEGSEPGGSIDYSELPNKNDSKFDTLMYETEAYKKYVNNLKDIFGEEYNKRDVDRALWVYGHLFKTKGTC